MLQAYKQDIKTNYIFKEPMKAYAYYALFQTVQLGNVNTLIFNPRNNKDDVKVFAAVATSRDTYYPGAERGKNLHNIAIEGMKDIRIIENQMAQQQIEGQQGERKRMHRTCTSGQQGTGTPPLRPQGQGGTARLPSLRQQREHQAHHDVASTLQQVSCSRTRDLSGISRP